MSVCSYCGKSIPRNKKFCSAICSVLSKATFPPDKSVCWGWGAGVTTSGYGKIGFSGKVLTAHRVTYAHFRGTIPKGMHVLHKCDNRRCCNPAHLYIGTNADNMRDKVERNRCVGLKGEQNGSAILTENDVRAILKRLSNGESCVAIAASYGVSGVLISAIRTGKSWKHVKRLNQVRRKGNRFTEDQVRDVHSRIAAGETQRSIAKDYGVSAHTITHIKRGKTWASIGVEPNLKTNVLDEETVLDIRQRIAGGQSLSGIARQLGVSVSRVWRIKEGKNYSSVK